MAVFTPSLFQSAERAALRAGRRVFPAKALTAAWSVGADHRPVCGWHAEASSKG